MSSKIGTWSVSSAALLLAVAFAGCAANAPSSTSSPYAGFVCPSGEAVVGFAESGPTCARFSAATSAAVPTPASTSPPPRTSTPTISLTSAGALVDGTKSYAIASASPADLKWSELTFTLDGSPLVYDGSLGNDNEYCVADGGSACPAGSTVPATTVDAGDLVKISHSSLSGKTLRVVAAADNAVLLTLVAA